MVLPTPNPSEKEDASLNEAESLSQEEIVPPVVQEAKAHQAMDTPEEMAPAVDESSATVERVDVQKDPPVDLASKTEKPKESQTAVHPETQVETQDEPPLKRGQMIEGEVVATTPLEITCTLGEGLVGVIPSHELERMQRRVLEEELQIGKKLLVYVINPRDHQGRILLSVNRALEEQDWQRAREYMREGRNYESHIAGYNKGGLIVRFGYLRGFVPLSQIAEARQLRANSEANEELWQQLVNQPIQVKVIEVNRKRSRLVLSERAANREQQEKRKAELLGELKVGDVRKGIVTSVADFGIFVDLGGVEGLVHNSELSWNHIKHARDRFKRGQEVTVEVISIDRERQRIGLSIKRQEADPWDEVAMRYVNGQLVRATITKLTKFGAFAQLIDTPKSEGLIHISELSDGRVEHPREVLQPGERLTLRIIRIDIRNRRLGLSLKRVNSAEYLDMDWENSLRVPNESQNQAAEAKQGSPEEHGSQSQEEEGAPEVVAAEAVAKEVGENMADDADKENNDE